MYLWHWPLATGLHYMELQHDWRAIIGVVVLTFALGHLSYVMVETRLRQPLERLSRGAVGVALAGACVAVILPAMLIAREDGFAQRLPTSVNAMFAAAKDHIGTNNCNILEKGNDDGCLVGGNKLSVIVMGDSHADAAFSAVSRALPSPSMGALNWSMAGCPSMAGMHSLRDDKLRCDAFIKWAVTRLHAIPADVPVVIINRTSLYMEGPNEDGLEQDVEVPTFYFSAPYPKRTAAFYKEVSERLIETACTMAKEHTVYLLRPVPEMKVNVPRTMARAMITGRERDISLPLSEYQQRHKMVWEAQDAARDRCGVKILDPLPYLCKGERCQAMNQGRSMYTDDNHLSTWGGGYLVPMFSRIFIDAPKAMPPPQQERQERLAGARTAQTR